MHYYTIKEAHERHIRQLLNVQGPHLPLDGSIKDSQNDDNSNDHILAALEDALQTEDFAWIRSVLETVITSLSTDEPWTNMHANLLYEVGFALWHDGEPGASIPRTARIQPMLDRIRDEFVGRMRRKIWKHVARMNSSHAVDEFCWVLAGLIEETPDDGFISMVNDVVEDLSKNTERFAPSQGMMELGNSLGLARFHRPNDEMYQEWIDALVIQVGTVLLDCGGEESAARHLMNNGFAYGKKPKRVRLKKYDSIDSASYERALDMIGIKRYA